jgi:hypothetical protein
MIGAKPWTFEAFRFARGSPPGLSHWRAVARQSTDETRVENVTGWIETGWPRSSRQPRPPDLRGLPHAGLPVAGRSDKRLGPHSIGCTSHVLRAKRPDSTLKQVRTREISQAFVAGSQSRRSPPHVLKLHMNTKALRGAYSTEPTGGPRHRVARTAELRPAYAERSGRQGASLSEVRTGAAGSRM